MFKNIQAFNEKNKEERYEIVVIHENQDGKQFAIYKNEKLNEGRTLDYNKLLGKQDWEILMKLGPKTIKMFLNLDDVEVLFEDGSSTGQKVKSSIFLILAVTPVDKVKDVIKAVKLMKKGDHLLEGVKLTAKELDMLRYLEKSGERVKIVEKGRGLKFGNAVKLEIHFSKHGTEIKQALNKNNYTVVDYLNDANHVIKEGQFVSEMNGYITLIGGEGSVKYVFMGLDRATENITILHSKSVKELAKKAPSLGLKP
ncbi:hypothetical protein [Enterococcus caccae]|uniref:Uncharacterized protein n=1 Tax=Enterococcus caccae ATCC BAA-1240 TaxID=1158612 RepID=R3WER2_9ENTE|nr:hypothetical protein [Enterococcus caccae]EOL46351.1 hypothetical protein UC7_01318 [Enterococcus caccae ATCC BAA-1240]EOT60720.1 hypothetical protein I580_01620 [Enterococcus caccae ATCC BAA-1240]OJG27470.1 hypothetical protein RU98_GL002559 [Enterococcus caccae]